MYRPSIALACLLAGCAVSLLAGCPASHARIDESPHAFVEAWFDAQCELALRCEFVSFRAWPAVHVCHPSAREQWRRMADAVLAGEARFDGAGALACVTALTASECVVPPDAVLPHEVCRDVLVGAAPEGATCEPYGPNGCDEGLGCELGVSCPRCVPAGAAGEGCVGASYACAEGLACVGFATSSSSGALRCAMLRSTGERCDSTDACLSDDPARYDGCFEGTCAPLPAVELGEECGQATGNCPDGAYCAVDRERFPDGDAPFTCVAFRSSGEPCGGAYRCSPGLRCTSSGTCGAIGILGDGCATNDDCGNDAPLCAFGVCARDAEGTPCRSLEATAPVRSVCPDDLVCPPYSRRCLRPAELGAPCNRTLVEVCGEGARCVDRICTAIVGPGGACTVSEVCPPLYECNGGRCTAFPTIGEPCREGCYGGVCRDGRCSTAEVGESCEHEPGDCEGACFADECAEPLREGDACDGGRRGFCASPLECVREDDGALRCRARSC